MEMIFEFLNQGIAAMNDVHNTVESYFDRAVIWTLITYFKIKLAGLELAWSIAKPIIETLNISSMLSNSVSSIPSSILDFFAFFKIFESLNNILTAFLTKFILDLIP